MYVHMHTHTHIHTHIHTHAPHVHPDVLSLYKYGCILQKFFLSLFIYIYIYIYIYILMHTEARRTHRHDCQGKWVGV